MTRLPAPLVSSALFRDLLAHFPSGVTIATALDRQRRPHGMTASAVAGLSLEPPLILICLDHTSDLHAILSDTRSFALSILAPDQAHLSRRFAYDRPDRFDVM